MCCNKCYNLNKTSPEKLLMVFIDWVSTLSLSCDSLVGLFFPCYGSFFVGGSHVFAWYNFVLCGHIAASHKELSIKCNAQIVILAFCFLFFYVFVVFDVVCICCLFDVIHLICVCYRHQLLQPVLRAPHPSHNGLCPRPHRWLSETGCLVVVES